MRLLQQCLRELFQGSDIAPGGAPAALRAPTRWWSTDGQRCHPHLLSAGTDQPRILRRWRSASDRAVKLCPASGRREGAGDRGVGSHEDDHTRARSKAEPPSIAQVVSHIRNSSFIDGMEATSSALAVSTTPSALLPKMSAKGDHATPGGHHGHPPSGREADSVAMRHAASYHAASAFYPWSGATSNWLGPTLAICCLRGITARDLVDMGYQGCHGPARGNLSETVPLVEAGQQWGNVDKLP